MFYYVGPHKVTYFITFVLLPSKSLVTLQSDFDAILTFTGKAKELKVGRALDKREYLMIIFLISH